MKKYLVGSALSFAAILAGLALGSLWQFGSVGNGLAYLRGERLVVDGPVQDLGEVQPGQLYPLQFRFWNLSSRPVRLVGFQSSCGCTTPSRLPLVIAPSSSEDLSVAYKPSSEPGAQSVDVRVYTDSPSRPEIGFRLKAQGFSPRPDISPIGKGLTRR